MQTVDHDQTGELLERLPKFELSYETISHKKVSPDLHNIAMAIPHGKKYYAWFSYDIAEDTLYIMELNKEKRITKIQKMPHSIGVRWSVGTLLYGVLLQTDTTADAIFVVEDLLQFQGFPMKNMTWGEKLPLLCQLFEAGGGDIGAPIRFKLPAIWAYRGDCDETTIPDRFRELPYQVHHIQYRSLCEIAPLLNFPIKSPLLSAKSRPPLAMAATAAQPARTSILDSVTIMRSAPCYTKPQYRLPTIFHVCADIQYDIYHLFAYGKAKSLVYYDLAYIPNYKVSVFMNGLFRNIRENRNLDSIEESDDEEDFQNVAEDKYVDLQRMLTIECRWHPKFRRWVPQCVVQGPCKVVHVSQL